MVRTRSAAAALVEAGHVRVNARRIVSAAHMLRPGDVVTLSLDSSVRLVRVEAFSERRGDASAAQALFQIVSKDRAGVEQAGGAALEPSPRSKR